MTRLKALNSGRLRVWYVTHREDAKASALLAIIVGLFLLVSHFDHQDALEQERIARRIAEERAAAAEGFAPELPRVAFVLDARTRQDLYDRLREIAGATDREAGELWRNK